MKPANVVGAILIVTTTGCFVRDHRLHFTVPEHFHVEFPEAGPSATFYVAPASGSPNAPVHIGSYLID